MTLILLRIRANVSVIVVGETWCGKTSLIRKLSKLMNNGECNMKILNIQAGITQREIFDFLFIYRGDEEGREIRSLVKEAQILQEQEEKRKYHKVLLRSLFLLLEYNK